MRLRDRSLFFQLMLIWLIGLTIVISVSFGIALGTGRTAVQTLLYEHLARDVESAVRLMNELPATDRERWLASLARPHYRFGFASPPEHAYRGDSIESETVVGILRAHLGSRLLDVRGELFGHEGRPTLYATIQLDDGTPFRVEMSTPDVVVPRGRALVAIVALLIGVLSLTWIAVRVATRPLARLGDAARALGNHPEREPLPVEGPREVREAAGAFNQMQGRIRDYLRERTRILAAISHDLQTPITRMRLRTEMIESAQLRDGMNADLDAMKSLVREGLDYARSLDGAEAACLIDIDGLLDTLRSEAEELGMPVAVAGRIGCPWRGRVNALRRALWNLIDNGVKYGGRVDIEARHVGDRLEIDIADAGPGIPVTELERVFEPYYRLESSRDRATGGSGLGLAIARNLLRAQGGDVHLANRPEGGLLARVTLASTDSAQIPGRA